jgi:hypothetical protein
MSKVLFTIANPINRKTIECKANILNMNEKEPETGYLINLQGRIHRMNVLDFNVGWVDWFIRYNLDLLHNHRCYIRTELIEDEVILTIAFNSYNKRAAIVTARDNGQDTIYDVQAGKELVLCDLDDNSDNVESLNLK